MEIWKDVIGFEELYQVSNLGRVKSKGRTCNHNFGGKARKRERILKQEETNCGYLRVTLVRLDHSKVRFSVHRLVAIHFVNGYEEELTVNHIDGNKHNNCADNLEWVTHKENLEHAMKSGLYDKEYNIEKVKEANSKKTIAYNDYDYKEFNSITECAKYLHTSVSAISYAVRHSGICKGYYVFNI